MGSSGSYHDSHVVELVGKILIVSIVALSVIIISVFFLHLYAKWFWYPRLRLRSPQQDTLNTRRHRHRSGVTVLRRGLNPSFLKTIPVISFDPKDFKDGLECTVCLSQVCQGEETRILPKCCHGFHVECIDMWFHSHSTCPICRDPVSDETAISVENLLETQQHQSSSSSSTDSGVGSYFPSNILFWGDETEVITLTSQLEEANSPSSSSYANNSPPRPDLVIDIPTQSDDDNDDDDDDDIEDQKSPVSSSPRMRSLTRILSGSRRFINHFGSVTPNIEQRTRAHL